MFIDEAKKQPWYENTLFVILADHTPATTSKVYSKRSQIYRIPIAFYDPSGRLKSTRSKKVFQQMDILPTLLDLLNIKTDYYAFGSSYFSDKPREAVTYLEGTYNYFREDMMMVYSGDQIHSMTNYVKKETNVDSLSQYSSKAGVWEKRLKAIIQTYNRDLINNKTSLD
jgi:phosphoglycerol transferase MdoB-like AlkP superfamily enzyme